MRETPQNKAKTDTEESLEKSIGSKGFWISLGTIALIVFLFFLIGLLEPDHHQTRKAKSIPDVAFNLAKNVTPDPETLDLKSQSFIAVTLTLLDQTCPLLNNYLQDTSSHSTTFIGPGEPKDTTIADDFSWDSILVTEFTVNNPTKLIPPSLKAQGHRCTYSSSTDGTAGVYIFKTPCIKICNSNAEKTTSQLGTFIAF